MLRFHEGKAFCFQKQVHGTNFKEFNALTNRKCQLKHSSGLKKSKVAPLMFWWRNGFQVQFLKYGFQTKENDSCRGFPPCSRGLRWFSGQRESCHHLSPPPNHQPPPPRRWCASSHRRGRPGLATRQDVTETDTYVRQRGEWDWRLSSMSVLDASASTVWTLFFIFCSYY